MQNEKGEFVEHGQVHHQDMQVQSCMNQYVSQSQSVSQTVRVIHEISQTTTLSFISVARNVGNFFPLNLIHSNI